MSDIAARTPRRAMLRELSAGVARAVILVVVLVLVAAGVFFRYFTGSTRKVYADFAAAIGVYQDSDVRLNGIKIGSVTSVTPDGAVVRVGMEYDSKYRLAANANAYIVSSSLVADRYVQLSPPFTGSGQPLADKARISQQNAHTPQELDDIYAALNKLAVGLGPAGANKNGALSDLLGSAAANLKGNGAALGQTIDNVSTATQTLANGSDDLFGTIQNLNSFTKTLLDSDTQVKDFNTKLATVASQLADERSSLSAALNSLTGALDSLASFVKDNQDKIHTDLNGLTDITNILVKDKSALNESLSLAPLALANLVHTYNGASGTLDVRSNLSSLTDAKNLCGIVNVLLSGNLASLGATAAGICTSIASGLTSGLPKTLGDLQQLISGLEGVLGGSIPIPGTS